MKKAELKGIMGFVSTDSTRPVIASLMVNSNGKNTTYVATDGYVLAEVVEYRAQEEMTTLIPIEKLNKAIKIVEKEDIQFSPNSIIIEDVTIDFTPTDATYPEYKAIIDRDLNGKGMPVLDPSYLITAANLFKAFGIKPKVRTSEGDNQAFHLEGSNDNYKAQAVIMPIKQGK